MNVFNIYAIEIDKDKLRMQFSALNVFDGPIKF